MLCACVRHSAGYRGAADPLHGDALNKAVRDMAQEVMTAIFDTSTPSEAMQNAGRMQAFGSNCPPGGCSGGAGSAAGTFQPATFAPSAGASAGAGFSPPLDPHLAPKVETGAYSTGRMQGFGNPNFQQKAAEPSKVSAIASSVAAAAQAGLSKMTAKASGSGCGGSGMASSSSSGGYGGVGGSGFANSGGGGYNPGAAAPAYSGAGDQGAAAAATARAAGRPGGGWGSPAPAQAATGAPPMVQGVRSTAAAGGPTGDYEAKLVEEVTAPGGVRATVPRDELRKFVAAAASLDKAALATLLEAKLSAPEWQRRLKALSLVEALIKEDDAGGRSSVVRTHFAGAAANIEAQLNSAQASLKDKARKVLELLGLAEGLSIESSSKTVPAIAAATAQPDLVDIAGEEANASCISSPPPPSDSLFADLTTAEAPPPPPAPLAPMAGGGMFDGMTQMDSPAAAVPPPSTPAELFGGLQLAGAGLAESHVTAPEPSPAPPAGLDGLDLSSMMGACAPAPSKPMGGASPMSGMGSTPMGGMGGGMGSSSMGTAMGGAMGGTMGGAMGGTMGGAMGGAMCSAMSGGINGGGMGSAMGGGGVADVQAMQQMAMMRQQMAMMQQQLMRQQMQMQGGGMAGGGMPGQMPAMPMQMSVGMGGTNSGMAPPSGGSEVGAAFDFMNAKGDDAFNFVGDVMKGNKRSL